MGNPVRYGDVLRALIKERGGIGGGGDNDDGVDDVDDDDDGDGGALDSDQTPTRLSIPFPFHCGFRPDITIAGWALRTSFLPSCFPSFPPSFLLCFSPLELLYICRETLGVGSSAKFRSVQADKLTSEPTRAASLHLSGG